jgi:replicative DNA helicase
MSDLLPDVYGGGGSMLVAPTNPAAEWSVLSHMLFTPDLIGEIVGVPLEVADFSQPDTRVIYSTTVGQYYANESVDPVIIGELARDELSQYWSADPSAVSQILTHRASDARISGSALEHAAIIKKLSTSRKIMGACTHALAAINAGDLSPEEIGDRLASDSLQVISGSVKRTEIRDWMTVGTDYVKQLQRVMQAKQQGIEIGVYTGLPFIDNFTTGIGPGELCFIAGDPGAGKTALAWCAAMGFANRQVRRAPETRVGTLVLSMEMNDYSSTARLVSNITGIDGTVLREGAITEKMYHSILTEWKNRENLPLYFNFSPNFRLSQMRALIAEAIRRANVGFVVIDHFRMIDTDRVYNNSNQEDEAKVRFIKENIARELNVAVMCLAHTIKVGRGQGGESPRPRLSDLRGSGQIAAFADFVAMAWNPNAYTSDDARDLLDAPSSDDERELLWVKNRFGTPSSAPYRFDAPRMRVSAH